MKLSIFFLLLGLLTLCLQANAAPVRHAQHARIAPILLYRTVGKRHCVLRESRFHQPGKIIALIRAASREKLLTAHHFMKRVPPVAYYGRLGPRDVLLFQDAESVHIRKGPQARQLVHLIDRICGKP